MIRNADHGKGRSKIINAGGTAKDQSIGVSVETEWGTLTEVIIGIAPGEHKTPIRFPVTLPNKAKFYTPDVRELLISSAGEPFARGCATTIMTGRTRA